MPLFENPRPPFSSSHLRAWSNNVEPRMRNRYAEYYERFNTVQIPIVGENDYFNDVMEVAELARGQEAEFERIFTERNLKRREKWLSLTAEIASQIIDMDENFPCKDAQNTVSEVCQTGCLLDFLRLLKGITYGWEADVVEDVQLDNATNLNDEIQSSIEEPQIIHENMQDHESIHGTLDEKADAHHTEIYSDTHDIATDSDYDGGTQFMDESECFKSLLEGPSAASKAIYLGDIWYMQSATPTFNGTTHNPNVLVADTSASENQNKELSTVQGKRKRARYDEDVIDASSQQAIDRSATDEKPPPDDGYGRVSKRQKLELPSTLEPTSINPPPPLAAHKRTSRKRSRHKNDNDDHDDDDYDHDDRENQDQRHKRRKLEAPSIQSVRDPKSAVAKTRLERNTSRNRKKSLFQTSRSLRPNTRSAKREEPFCELDHSGKRRAV